MIISFIGPPGCGKSTQIELVRKRFFVDVGAIMLRVPNLVKKHPDILPYLTDQEVSRIDALAESSYECRDKGRLSPVELDLIMFDVAERCLDDNKFVVLDGAPRGLEQAVSYCRSKYLLKRTIVVHLFFQNQALENSVSRQFYRESLSRGIETAIGKIKRFSNKFETYETDTTQGFNLLKEHNVPYIEIDALLQKSEVAHRLEGFLSKQILKHTFTAKSGGWKNECI